MIQARSKQLKLIHKPTQKGKVMQRKITVPENDKIQTVHPDGTLGEVVSFFWMTLTGIINNNLKAMPPMEILDFMDTAAVVKAGATTESTMLVLTEAQYQKLYRWIEGNKQWASNNVAEVVPLFFLAWKNVERVE